MKKQKIDTKVIITGLICLTALEVFALHKGIDGVILTTVMAIIAGAIGVMIPTPKVFKK